VQIINYKLDSEDCNLFLFGDVHTGSLMSHEIGFKKMVNMMHSEYDGVKSKYNYAVDHGDMIEAIEVRDKRFCMETTKTKSIDKQVQEAIDMRLPIKDKLICCLKGNHEHSIIRFTNAAERVCLGAGIRYGTYSAIINYTDKKGHLMFKHFATHGNGTVKSDADDPVRQLSNKRLSLKRKLKNKFGDCLLNTMGHTHQLIILKPEPILYLTSQSGSIEQHYTAPKKTSGYIEPNHKWYANTGSFLKLYFNGVDSYAERALYDPVELGFIICKIRNRTVSELVKVTI
jgi:hypothetical protein